jgi:hypothetical protein
MARPRYRSARVAAIGLALVAMARLAYALGSCEPASLGCAIFNGQHPLSAHLRDDNSALPAWTTRCVNCHVGASASTTFAPPLTRDYLLGATRRRGGPISHYDPAAFCHAVKDGVDPAGIVLRKPMPRYQMTDAECSALWRFVTTQ